MKVVLDHSNTRRFSIEPKEKIILENPILINPEDEVNETKVISEHNEAKQLAKLKNYVSFSKE